MTDGLSKRLQNTEDQFLLIRFESRLSKNIRKNQKRLSILSPQD
ncbi:hypothetical protein [Sessilibacter sp. MAH4]